jgi:hypothetical protein
MVTLWIEGHDGSLTKSGWSTRVADGAAQDKPFEFVPGVNLIEGWTEGVLQMMEGERAKLHVPSAKGYGAKPQGSPGGGWYIPANSNLCFDIEIIGLKANGAAAAPLQAGSHVVGQSFLPPVHRSCPLDLTLLFTICSSLHPRCSHGAALHTYRGCDPSLNSLSAKSCLPARGKELPTATTPKT